MSYAKIRPLFELNLVSKIYRTPPNAKDFNQAPKFRKLKELASSSNDHNQELLFFRQEMLAKRGNEVHGIESGLINIYEYFSKCGLSIRRPLFALCGFFLLFWAIYHFWYTGIEFDPIHNTNWQDIMTYAAHNALPLISANQSEKIAIIEKLFGSYSNRPIWFGILSFIQNLIGFALYFLTLLAIRNYFRMK